MKVVVSISDLEIAVPELIPGIRQAADDLPMQFTIEAGLHIDEQRQRELREQFPEYFDGLTLTEWRIFCELFIEKAASRNQLKAAIATVRRELDEWGNYTTSNVVDVHVKNLRKQLLRLGDKHWIETKRGWGYKMREGSAPPEPTKKAIPMSMFGRRIAKPETFPAPKRWRKGDALNPVEFGFLKEMRMDDIPKGEVAKRLAISEDAVEAAWEAKNFTHYSNLAKRPSKKKNPVF